MDFFTKTKIHQFDDEEKSAPFDQYLKIPELKENISAETDMQEKNTYYPNPALFRRLIEGTSFDHRTRKEEKEEEQRSSTGVEDAATGAVHSYLKKKKESSKRTVQKRVKKEENVSSSSKKKQFIVKERKRLGNIVHEVLGYPQDQNN